MSFSDWEKPKLEFLSKTSIILVIFFHDKFCIEFWCLSCIAAAKVCLQGCWWNPLTISFSYCFCDIWFLKAYNTYHFVARDVCVKKNKWFFRRFKKIFLIVIFFSLKHGVDINSNSKYDIAVSLLSSHLLKSNS